MRKHSLRNRPGTVERHPEWMAHRARCRKHQHRPLAASPPPRGSPASRMSRPRLPISLVDEDPFLFRSPYRSPSRYSNPLQDFTESNQSTERISRTFISLFSPLLSAFSRSFFFLFFFRPRFYPNLAGSLIPDRAVRLPFRVPRSTGATRRDNAATIVGAIVNDVPSGGLAVTRSVTQERRSRTSFVSFYLFIVFFLFLFHMYIYILFFKCDRYWMSRMRL